MTLILNFRKYMFKYISINSLKLLVIKVKQSLVTL